MSESLCGAHEVLRLEVAELDHERVERAVLLRDPPEIVRRDVTVIELLEQKIFIEHKV